LVATGTDKLTAELRPACRRGTGGLKPERLKASAQDFGVGLGALVRALDADGVEPLDPMPVVPGVTLFSSWASIVSPNADATFSVCDV
jgi:hypothetical protein